MQKLISKFVDGHSVTFDRSDINLYGTEFELIIPESGEAFYRVKLDEFVSEIQKDITLDYPSDKEGYVDLYMSEIYDAHERLKNGIDILKFYENRITYGNIGR